MPLSNVRKNIIKEKLFKKILDDSLLKNNLRILKTQTSNFSLIQQL